MKTNSSMTVIFFLLCEGRSSIPQLPQPHRLERPSSIPCIRIMVEKNEGMFLSSYILLIINPPSTSLSWRFPNSGNICAEHAELLDLPQLLSRLATILKSSSTNWNATGPRAKKNSTFQIERIAQYRKLGNQMWWDFCRTLYICQ